MKWWIPMVACLLAACPSSAPRPQAEVPEPQAAAEVPEAQEAPEVPDNPPEPVGDGSPEAVDAGAPPSAPGAPPAQAAGPSLQEFQQAHAAFTRWATAQAKGAPVKVLPDRIEGIGRKPDVGPALAFQASWGESLRRGWATPQGAVATLPDAPGPLVEASGLWTDAPRVGKLELARALAWALDQRLMTGPLQGAHPPKLQADALIFFVASRRPGPGGAGGGPEVIERCVLQGRALDCKPWKP